MITIFPFIISFDNVSTFILSVSNGMPVSTETMLILWVLINFINIWFIIKLLEIFLKTFKKIISILF